MSFVTMSDEQIIEFIASSLENTRLKKRLKAEDMSKKGGYNAQTYSNFVNQGTNIKLKTLIQMFRGLGELERLEKVFNTQEAFRPTIQQVKIPKRVFSTKKKKIEWGEE